jgi:hypothetical protein
MCGKPFSIHLSEEFPAMLNASLAHGFLGPIFGMTSCALQHMLQNFRGLQSAVKSSSYKAKA